MPSNVKLNAESFIGLVKQSNLVDQDVLKKLWQEFTDRGIDPSDPRSIADELVARNVLTRWQADKLLQRKHKGFFLGKYRLLSHVGSGGMSAVYLAEHVLMRRRVAIKVLPTARVEDSSYLQRFHREAQAVAALDHRNIVRAYDVDQEGSVHFLVMEFVSGKSLHDLVISEGRLDYIPAVEYMRQAAEGLQHAHRMGMVHRDIKPGNLLLDDKGTVKLLDLGLARFFEDKEEHSLTIQHDEKVLGTADFLSPEQAIDSHNVDIRSDIYSLGCTLYFLLAGRPPFPDGALAQRLLAHQTKEPEPLSRLRSDFPRSLVPILERMMAKKPDARYQTARETSTALQQWLSEYGGEAWAKMSPVIPGSGSAISGAAKPSSGVLESDTVAHGRPPGSEATEIGPGRPARSAPGSGPDSTKDANSPPSAAPLETVLTEEHAEPELAAFLSHLAADKADSPMRTTTAERGPREPQPVASPAADAEFAPTTVRPKPDSGTSRSQPAPAVARSRENPPGAAPQAETTPRPTGSGRQVRSGDVSSRAPAAPNASVGQPKPARTAAPAPAPSSKTIGSRRTAGDQSLAPEISPAPAAERSPGTNRRMVVAVAVGAILLLSVAGYFLYDRGNSRSSAANPKKNSNKQTGTPDKKPSQRAAPLRRELTVGPDGTFRSIAAALADARQNGNDSRKATQIIKVAAGQTYPERIVIDESYPRGIQIVAEDGPPAILAPIGSEPIVVVSGGKEQVENFRLEGFHLLATGKDVAIQLSDWVPAAKLKRLRISGFKESGILLDGTQTFGAESDRIVLEDVSFRDAAPEAAGVRFRRKAEDPMHVRLQRCRFLTPLAAGVTIESGVIDVEILESIFFGTRTGIRLEGADRTWRDVVLAFNTFYENDRGVVLANMPGAGSSGFGFHNNLFVGSQTADALVEKDYVANALFSMFRSTPGGASHNWTTRPKLEAPPPQQLSFLFENVQGRFGVADLQFQSLDPEHADFLAPAANSPHQHVGTLLDRRKFGDQIGAVRGK